MILFAKLFASLEIFLSDLCLSQNKIGVCAQMERKRAKKFKINAGQAKNFVVNYLRWVPISKKILHKHLEAFAL